MQEGALQPFLWPVSASTTSNGVHWETLPTFYRISDKYILWPDFIAGARPIQLPVEVPSGGPDDELDELFDPDAGQKRARK
jgi:hypothetical protein